MNRSKLSENLSRLNETEIDILTYVTKLSIDWFNDLTNSDDKVEYALRTPFSYYSNTDGHPMNKVYDKIVDGIYGTPLFELATGRRGKDFEDIANEHDYDDDVTLEVFLQNFEKVYIDDLVYWFDERDLKTILLFCGEG